MPSKKQTSQYSTTIRDEANDTKSCVTDFVFKSFTLSAGALAVVFANIDKIYIELAVIPVIFLCLLINRISVYKYTTANRNYAYEFHLNKLEDRYKNKTPTEFKNIGWEEAMFAWRIVSPKVLEYLYPSLGASQFFGAGQFQRKLKDSLKIYPWFDTSLLEDAPTLEEGAFLKYESTQDPQKPNYKVSSKGLDPTARREYNGLRCSSYIIALGTISSFIFFLNVETIVTKYCLPQPYAYAIFALLMHAGLICYFFATSVLPIRKKTYTGYVPGTYLRHIQSALNMLAMTAFLILIYAFWSKFNLFSTTNYSIFLYIIIQSCSIVSILRVAHVRHRRKILETGLFSIQTSSLLWHIVFIIIVKAKRSIPKNSYFGLTSAISKQANIFVNDMEKCNIHAWISKNLI